MNYMTINPRDHVNGPGVRVSLFVSGCTHGCIGCFNQAAMRFTSGQKFTRKSMVDILDSLDEPYIGGFSILGGDPLMPENYEDVLKICKCVKSIYPLKSIWVWTGYVFDQVKADYPEILSYIDVLVDGPYCKDLLPEPYRGSSNQKIWVKTNQKEFIECTKKMLDILV